MKRLIVFLICCWLTSPSLGRAQAASSAESSTSQMIERIGQLVEQNQLGEAETLVRQLLARQDDPLSRDLLGVVLSRQRRYEEAREQFQAALAADPGLQTARQHLARLWLLQERRPEALAELRRAAALGPLEADLAMTLGNAEMAAGRTAEAEAQFLSVADRFSSVQALMAVAKLRSNRRDFGGAMDILRHASSLAPSSEEVLRAYARSAVAASDYITAIRTLESLIRMHPDIAEYSYLMGLARLQVGDPIPAAEALENARRLQPTKSLTLIALGVTYNGQKRYNEAKQILLECLRIEPDSLEALAALAEAEEGLSELAAAEEHAQRALAKDPSHLTANLVLGLLRMRQDRFQDAVEILQRVIQLDPESSKAHYQLSLAHARLGDRAASQSHLELYQAARQAAESRRAESADAIGDSP